MASCYQQEQEFDIGMVPDINVLCVQHRTSCGEVMTHFNLTLLHEMMTFPSGSTVHDLSTAFGLDMYTRLNRVIRLLQTNVQREVENGNPS
jgi:hypothetical protein